MTDINQNLRYFGQQQADIDQAKILAQALRESNMLNNYNPNQMVGDRVVPLSPVTALIGGLTKGYESYLNARNTREQSDLNTRKKEILSNLFSGNEMPSMAMLSQSGMFEPNELFDLYQKKQLMDYKTQARQYGTPGSTYIPPGSVLEKNEQTSGYYWRTPNGAIIPDAKSMTEAQRNQYSPDVKRNLSYAEQEGEEGAKIHEIDTMHGKQFLRGDQLTNGRMPTPPGNQKPVFDYRNGNTNITIHDRENLSQLNNLVKQNPELLKDQAFAEQYNAALGIPQPNVQPQQGFGITPEQKNALEVQKQKEIERLKTDENLRGKEGESELDRENKRIELQKNLPDFKAKTDELINLVNQIKNSKGFEGEVGLKGAGHFWPLGGTHEAGTQAMLEKLKGNEFIKSIQEIQQQGKLGLSPISNEEGKQLVAAQTSLLNTDQPEEDWKKAADEYIQKLMAAQKRMEELIGVQVESNQQTPQAIKYDANETRLNELRKKHGIAQ